MYLEDFTKILFHLNDIKKVVITDIPQEWKRAGLGKEQLPLSEYILFQLNTIEEVLKHGAFRTE